MKSFLLSTIFLVGAIGLAACGGDPAKPLPTKTASEDDQDKKSDTVANKKPVIASVAIPAGNYFVTSELTVTVDASDAEASPLTFAYEWLVNGTVVSTSETLQALFQKGDQVAVRVIANDGELDSEAVTSSAITIQNTLPVISGVALDAETYFTDTTISVSANGFSDADGDTPLYTYEWYVDGVKDTEAGPTLSASAFSKGKTVYVRVTPGDGEGAGTPISSSVVTIQNSLPVLTGATIGAGPHDTNGPITVTAVGFSDADGDLPNHTYTWFVDDDEVAHYTNSLPGSFYKKGERVRARITPGDGEGYGVPVDSNEVSIVNSAPSIASVTFTAGAYFVNTAISVTANGYNDIDDDLPGTHQYQWYVNDILQSETSNTLPSTGLTKGDRVYVRVTPSDGSDSGSPVDSTEITILNSPPSFDSVSIGAGPYYTNDSINAVPAGYSDVDTDLPGAHQYTWYVDNAVVQVDTSDWLSSDKFSKGNVIYAHVKPFDGTTYGVAVSSNAVTIQNSPPSISQAIIPTNTSYYTNSSISVTTFNFYDADGDTTESYTYQWFVNGDEVEGETTDTLAGTHFSKDNTVYTVVTPSDGISAGTPRTSNTVTIQNTAPSISSVSIGDGPYYTNDSITGTVTATDDDGDDLTYEFVWKVSGADKRTEEKTSNTDALDGTLHFSKSDTVQLAVRVHDSDASYGSASWSNSKIIQNSAPGVAGGLYWQVYEGGALEGLPDQISDAAEDLYVNYTAAFDPDGDTITYHTTWKRNGTQIATGSSTALKQSIGQEHIIGGSTITVDVVASDGTLSSAAVNHVGNVSKPGVQFIETALGTHTCAIDELGALTCWGTNDKGQVGNGTSGNNFAHPQPVSGLGKDVIDVALSFRSSCALKRDKSVWCWGQNTEGQLGNGTFDAIAHPTPAKVTSLSSVIDIEAGYDHFCALHEDTSVSCWGWNQGKQLGNPSASDPQTTPIKAKLTNSLGATSDLTGVVKVQAGSQHTCALMSSGSIMCWGDDTLGQVGTSNLSDPWPTARTSFEVTGISTAVDIAAGQAHTCALLSDGTVKCWGYNLDGQLGNGDKINQPAPVQVKTSSAVNLTSVTALSAGRAHTCALRSTGVLCWGADNAGQLGNDTALSGQIYATNHAMMKTTALAPVQISAGYEQTCALSKEGGIWCWGTGGNGVLGNGSMASAYIPVENIKHRDQNAVSAGEAFGCALDRNGKLSCWGRNNKRQVADTTTTEYLSPTAGHYDRGVDAIATGSDFACALLRTSAVTCWGSNAFKQTGLSTPLTYQGTPNQVIASGAVQVVAGSRHACAVLQDGTAKCWGDNSDGQLGRGTITASENTATAVLKSAGVTLTGIASMSAGSSHTCAVLATGGVLCFGADNAGQLGNGGTTGSKAYGENVLNSSGLSYSTAIQVAAGYAHNCLITQTGAVSCWGEGSDGQLGDSYNTDRTRAETTLSGSYLTVAASINHTCGALVAGNVYCWGTNTSGELGTSTGGITSTPAAVQTSFSAKHLSLGDRFTLGHVSIPYAWGRNENGRTGSGLSDTGFHNSRTSILLP